MPCIHKPTGSIEYGSLFLFITILLSLYSTLWTGMRQHRLPMQLVVVIWI